MPKAFDRALGIYYFNAIRSLKKGKYPVQEANVDRE
jgi:hypothetical protein